MSSARRYTEPAQERYYCPVCATLLSIQECERSGHLMEGCKYVECYHFDTSYVGWPKRFLWITEPADASQGCADAARTLKNASAAMWGSLAVRAESKTHQPFDANEPGTIDLYTEDLRLRLSDDVEGEVRMLLVSLHVLRLSGRLRVEVRWDEAWIRSSPGSSGGHNLPYVLVRPTVTIFVPSRPLSDPIIMVVHRLHGVHLHRRMLVAISFYEGMDDGRRKVLVDIEVQFLRRQQQRHAEIMQESLRIATMDHGHGTGKRGTAQRRAGTKTRRGENRMMFQIDYPMEHENASEEGSVQSSQGSSASGHTKR
ncbi:hypothetical protein C8Q76DRAFT_694792 [Earliella scabrosa]|nr:hypothetical protein C8Q76DRAFT_694792 [Earliella scabrosa]